MILDRFRLDDQVALVTGAGRGIGRGIARAYAEAGAHVVCAARTREQIEDAAEEIRGLGRRALAVPCDVMDDGQLDALVAAALDEFGRIDVLVNNAGGSPPTPVLQLTDKAFESAFHFNVTTALHLSRQVLGHMVKRAGDGAAAPEGRAQAQPRPRSQPSRPQPVGSIVNISSGLARLVEPGFVAYGTAKAALSHMTRLMAVEFAPHVRVNAIAVGATLTDALAPFVEGSELKEQMEALTPMRRLGSTEDIAAAALYLASPAASWVTGKVFEVDGGTEASNWPIKIPAF